MAKCPKCGAIVEDGSKFCDECGAAIPQTKECQKCHAQLKPNAKFCSECGFSFAGKATPAGLAMGDKNVIAGDVVGYQESYSISGNATIVKNEDETKKMVECHVCGKHLPITGAFTCPSCHEIVCEDCYDRNLGLCTECVTSAQTKKETEYRDCLAKVYADGRVELSERKELNALRNRLGLSEGRAAELEAAFKSSGTDEDALGDVEKMYCERAQEAFLGNGDAAAALKEVESVYAKHSHNETVLRVYLPALAVKDAREALNLYSAVR